MLILGMPCLSTISALVNTCITVVMYVQHNVEIINSEMAMTHLLLYSDNSVSSLRPCHLD